MKKKTLMTAVLAGMGAIIPLDIAFGITWLATARRLETTVTGLGKSFSTFATVVVGVNAAVAAVIVVLGVLALIGRKE